MRILSILLLWPALAHAGEFDNIPDEAGPIPSESLRWEVSLGPSAAFLQDGLVHGAVGGRLRGGIEKGRIAFLGVFDLYHLQRACEIDCVPGDAPGHAYRFAADVRVDVMQHRVVHGSRRARYRWERFDVAIDASLGRETIMIDDDGTRSRPDVGLGVSLTLTNRAGHGYGGLRAGIQLADNNNAPDGSHARRTSFVVGFDAAIGN
jgi:hypothetical protein